MAATRGLVPVVWRFWRRPFAERRMPGPPNDRRPLSSFALAALRLTQSGSDAPGAAISGASVRLRALAALSGSLTDALGPQDAADLVERQALFALGATSAV